MSLSSPQTVCGCRCKTLTCNYINSFLRHSGGDAVVEVLHLATRQTDIQSGAKPMLKNIQSFCFCEWFMASCPLQCEVCVPMTGNIVSLKWFFGCMNLQLAIANLCFAFLAFSMVRRRSRSSQHPYTCSVWLTGQPLLQHGFGLQLMAVTMRTRLNTSLSKKIIKRNVYSIPNVSFTLFFFLDSYWSKIITALLYLGRHCLNKKKTFFVTDL